MNVSPSPPSDAPATHLRQPAPDGRPDPAALAVVDEALTTIRSAMIDLADRQRDRIRAVADVHRRSAENLLHYVALRRVDLRDLQKALIDLGCSSLGRAEGHVLDNVERVLALVRPLRGRGFQPTAGVVTREEAADACEANAAKLLGPGPRGRRPRLMVTAPDEIAEHPSVLDDLLAAGMDVLRINGAKGAPAEWATVAEALDAARRRGGRSCLLQIDLRGPGLRTAGEGWKHRVRTGDRLRLVEPDAEPSLSDRCVPLSDLASLRSIASGDRVVYDDGKIGAVADTVDERGCEITVTHVRGQEASIKPGKSLNVPDRELPLATLSGRDHDILAFAAARADLLGVSFVRGPEDVATVDAALQDACRSDGRVPGLVLKIENAAGFRNLPWILLEAMRRERLGIMIARGDLAAEIGFERLSEVQEEMLWLCEAAHVPAVWATEVFEHLAKSGVPLRGELTDAFMAGRSECVMLNKGPHIVDAVRSLDDILRRMAGHLHKKTPWLRRLESWS